MNSIKCLKQYNSDDDDEIWFSPLGHPDIEYGIFSTSLREEGTEIFFIGSLGKEYGEIHEYEGMLVAFVDDNKKIISPVLFHESLTVGQNAYKEIYEEIMAFSRNVFGEEPIPTDEQPESESSEKTFADVLDESFRGNTSLYDFIKSAIYNGTIKNSNVVQQSGFTMEQICKELGDMKIKPEEYEEKYSRNLHTIIEALKDEGVPSYE
jgi:hypothetical protein